MGEGGTRALVARVKMELWKTVPQFLKKLDQIPQKFHSQDEI
jgi:hypothetical protein